MENNIQKEANESFKSIIQPITGFVYCTVKLPEIYASIYYDLTNYAPIEYKVQKYLNNQDNIKQLQHYITVLKRISDKKIKESIPNGSIDESNVLFNVNQEESIRKVIREKINEMTALITGILDRYKILSAKTEYFNYEGKYQKLQGLESELEKGKLIEHTAYFFEIFKGEAPNERINWIGSASSFRYFINLLFNTELFNDKKHKWIISENTFTINSNLIPENIRTYKDNDVKPRTQRIIKDAVFSLND